MKNYSFKATRATKDNIIDEQGHLIKESDRRDFAKAVNLLNKVIQNIREYHPEANLYVEDYGNFNLMIGDSHENGRPRHDRVALHWIVWNSGGGGW